MLSWAAGGLGPALMMRQLDLGTVFELECRTTMQERGAWTNRLNSLENEVEIRMYISGPAFRRKMWWTLVVPQKWPKGGGEHLIWGGAQHGRGVA